MKHCDFSAFLMASLSFAGAAGQTRSKQLSGSISAGRSTVEPVLRARLSTELRFAWHSGEAGPEGARGRSLILRLGPSQPHRAGGCPILGCAWPGRVPQPSFVSRQGNRRIRVVKSQHRSEFPSARVKSLPRAPQLNTWVSAEPTRASHTLGQALDLGLRGLG